MDSEVTQKPWFRDRSRLHPFTLIGQLSTGGASSSALFPWVEDSLSTLWQGHFNDDNLRNDWINMVHAWSGALAIGTKGALDVVSVSRSAKSFRVSLPAHGCGDHTVRSIAWALLHSVPFEPLILMSSESVLYIVNATRAHVAGYIRGHGGLITSIAVHPMLPHMICTTSRDFTARIYNLTQSPDQGINHIPGSLKATDRLYGAPHGLRMVESEGKGIGRCTVVLMGSESGGHASSVLGAAFHPSLPLIATCGLDHAVKIWRLPLSVDEGQHREDRPVFSSSRIHKSRVLSVAWLDQDVLLTHSAPVLVREENGESVEFHYEDGIMAVWCWLGIDRYLPPGQPWSEKSVPGCKSDYRDSFSFKLLASASLPQETRDLRVYRMPTRDPLVIISLPSSIRLVNVIHLPKRKVQPFPLDKDVLAEATARQLDDGEEDEVVSLMGAQNSKPAMVEGWEIKVPNRTLESQQQVQHSIMGLNGSLLVAAGSKGTVWLWQTK